MIETKIQGFVVNKVVYKENDAIFNVLCADQMYTFKARGILKITSKNAPACNYCLQGEYVLASKLENNKYNLKTASIIKMYHVPYDNLQAMSVYLTITEIAYKVYETNNIYKLCIECFDKLERNEAPLNVLVYFLKELINILGYQPDLSGCINCHKKQNLISFSLEEGGFICSNCFDSNKHIKYSNDYLKSILKLYKEDDYLSIIDTRVNKMVINYLTFLKNEVGIYLKNENILMTSMEA